MIELGHRLSSGLLGVFVAAFNVFAFRTLPRGHGARRFAFVSLLFVVSEALIGAGLVRFEWVAGNVSEARVYVMAFHLVNTFLLLAALTLTAWLAGGLEPVAQDESRASYVRTGIPRLSPVLKAEMLARICATLGSQRKLKLDLGGRRVAIRAYRGRSTRTGAPPRIRPLTVSVDVADARCSFSRWLPGTRGWRDARWLLRVALAPSR